MPVSDKIESDLRQCEIFLNINIEIVKLKYKTQQFQKQMQQL